jgi:hypothetical protein
MTRPHQLTSELELAKLAVALCCFMLDPRAYADELITNALLLLKAQLLAWI